MQLNTRPATIRNALHELVRFGTVLLRMPCSSSLAKGKYGADLLEEARLAVLAATSDIGNPADALLTAVYHQMLPMPDAEGYAHAAQQCMDMLESQELIVRCEGADCLGMLALDIWKNKADMDSCRDLLICAAPLLEKMLFEESAVGICAAAFALGRIGASRVWVSERPYVLVSRLAELWRLHPDTTVSHRAVQALIMQAVVPRDGLHLNELLSGAEFDSLWAGYGQLDAWEGQPAALLIAYYRRAADDAEIISHAQQLLKKRHPNTKTVGHTLRELLEQLGAPLEAEKIVTADDGNQGKNEAT